MIHRSPAGPEHLQFRQGNVIHHLNTDEPWLRLFGHPITIVNPSANLPQRLKVLLEHIGAKSTVLCARQHAIA
jgi:hypothetical protein